MITNPIALPNAGLHGNGGNGKSVFVATLAGILGSYHKTAPIETFTAQRYGSSHPTELAMLRGARLVTAVETEEGRSWAQAKICTLTGGDKIPARFMRQDFFEFIPTFKPMICGNHKPRLRTINEAIKRRVQMIPFLVTVKNPDKEVDPRGTGGIGACQANRVGDFPFHALGYEGFGRAS